MLPELISNHSEEIAQLAAECGIDWYAVTDLSNGKNKNPPLLHKKYKDKSIIWVSEFELGGNTHIGLRFFTNKHGGVSRKWDSYSAEKENRRPKVRTAREKKPSLKNTLKKKNPKYSRKELYLWHRNKFQMASPAESFNYLDEKGISDISCHFDLRESTDRRGRYLLVPLYNERAVYVGHQRIYEDGAKKLTTGIVEGSYGGAHAIIGNPDDSPTIYIAEGFATAAAITLATGCASVMAYSAHNLLRVTAHIKSKYGDSSKIVIAADDDSHKAGNTGIYLALKAAKRNRVKIVVPPKCGKKTDWADVWLTYRDEMKHELEKNKDNFLRAAAKKIDYTLQLIEYAHPLHYPKLIREAGRDAKIPYLVKSEALSKTIEEITRKKISKEDVLQLLKGVEVANSVRAEKISSISCENVDESKRFFTSQNSDGFWTITQKTSDYVLSELEKGRLVIVRSPMGSGKTQYLTKNAIGAFSRAAHILPRVSIVDDSAGKLDLAHYKDVDEISAHFTEQLTSCINSMGSHRFWTDNTNWFENLDLLCLDEASQMISQIVQLGRSAQKTKNYEAFSKSLRSARGVLITDADANEFMLDELRKIDPERKITLVDVEHPCQAESSWNIRFTDKIKHVQTELLESIQQGEKVLLATDNKKRALEIKEFLKLIKPSLKVLVIHREPSAKDQDAVTRFTKNTNEEAKKYDVLIYTPAITSGVSIESQHFTRHFAIFTGVIKVNDMIQMMGRDRTAKDWYLAVSSARTYTKFDETLAARGLEELGEAVTPFAKLKFATENYEREARTGLIMLALNILEKKGHRITLAEEISSEIGLMFHDSAKAISDYLDQKRRDLILGQEEIDERRYREISSKWLPTEEEAAAKYAYLIRNKLCTKLNNKSLDFMDGGGLKKVELYEVLFAESCELRRFDNDQAHLDPTQKYFAVYKNHVMKKVISMLGIRSEFKGEFTHRDSLEVVRYFLAHSERINQIFGQIIDKENPPRCATSFVKKILGLMGLELGKRKTKGNMVRFIEPESVEWMEKLYEGRAEACESLLGNEQSAVA